MRVHQAEPNPVDRVTGRDSRQSVADEERASMPSVEHGAVQCRPRSAAERRFQHDRCTVPDIDEERIDGGSTSSNSTASWERPAADASKSSRDFSQRPSFIVLAHEFGHLCAELHHVAERRRLHVWSVS
jgi:hypothetical protein